MGCGRTLYLASTGNIVCSRFKCPDHLAVTRILDNKETEHIVKFEDGDRFTVKHPLRERIEDDLMNCELCAYLEGLSFAPVEAPGTYRATHLHKVQWAWERIDEVG
jgi:hypothetical protein